MGKDEFLIVFNDIKESIELLEPLDSELVDKYNWFVSKYAKCALTLKCGRCDLTFECKRSKAHIV